MRSAADTSGAHRNWWPDESIVAASAPVQRHAASQQADTCYAGTRLTSMGHLSDTHEPTAVAATEQLAGLELGMHVELQWTATTIMVDILPGSMQLKQPLQDAAVVEQPVATMPTPAVLSPEPEPALPTLTSTTPHPEHVKVDAPLQAAVFLTAASHDMLLLLVPPLHPVVQADHMVVKLWPTAKDLLDLPVGAEVSLQVVGIAADHIAQAVLVVPPAWLSRPDSLGPHIPLSKSASASEEHAGSLLMHGLAGLNTCYHHLPEPFMVYGRLGVSTSSRQVVYSTQELLQSRSTGNGGDVAPHMQQQPAAALANLIPTYSQLQNHSSPLQLPSSKLSMPAPAAMPPIPPAPVPAPMPVAGAAWAPRPPVPQSTDFPPLEGPTAPSAPEAAALQSHAQSPAASKTSLNNTPNVAVPSVSTASTPVPVSSSVSSSKIPLKSFMKLDHASNQGKPGPGSKAGSLPKASSAATLERANEQGVDKASGRVCWLQELGLGDYVAVAPLVGPASKSSMSPHRSGDGGFGGEGAATPLAEGFIEEVLADEPYQPLGVMVRLHDNTMGYVARLVAKRGPAAAEAAKAHARWLRQQRQGSDSDDGLFARPARLGKVQGSSQQQQSQRATSQPGNASATASLSGGAGAGAGTLSEGVPGSRSEGGAEDHQDQQSNPSWHAWEQYKQQYGEALTSAVLDDCGGDVDRAVQTLAEQAALLGSGDLDALDGLVARAVSQAAAVAFSKLAAEQEQDRQRRAARQAARSGQHATAHHSGGAVASGQQVRLLTPASGSSSPIAYAGGVSAGGSYGSSDSLKGIMLRADMATATVAAPKAYHATAEDNLEPARGALLKSNWRAAALQGRATERRSEAPSTSSQQSVPGASGSAFPPLKLLVRPDSLATTAAQAGQHIRSAEALKSLLPGYSSQAVVAALGKANGDVNRAADLLLASGPPTELEAVAAAVVPLWDNSSSSSSEDEEQATVQRRLRPQDQSIAATVAAGPASERSMKVTQLVRSFEGLDRSLAEFLLRQCGGDVERTSRYIMEEVLGKPAAASSFGLPAAAPSGPSARLSSNGGMQSTGISRKGAAPSPARGRSSRSRPTWQTVPESKPKPRRPPPRYVVGDDPETNTARQTARLEADQERRMAQVYYDARNVYFQRAAAAYSAGDGRLAAECSRKGREMSHLAHQHRDNANEAAYRASNTSIRNQYVIDLHYLYVEEALGMLRHTMATLEALNTPQGLDLKVITGMGHHSANNVPVIKNAVLSWLKEKGIRSFVDPTNEGVVCVRIGTK